MAASISPRPAGARRSCSNTTPTRRRRFSRPAVFQWMWLEDAKARAITPEGCRPVQFAARTADRRLEGDRPESPGLPTPASRGRARRSGRRRHHRVSGRHGAAGRAYDHQARDGLDRPHAERRVRRSRRQTDRAAVQALSVGVDVPRAVRRFIWPARRRAGSSRRGRRSCRTRASCRCSGPCSRVTPICCRPISRTMRRPPSSATPIVRKPLYSREGANVTIMVGGQAVDRRRPVRRRRLRAPGGRDLPGSARITPR